MSDDTHVRVNHRVPEHVRDTAQKKTEHGEMSERVRAIYRQVAYGEVYDERSQLQARLDEVTDELSDARRKRNDIESRISDLESEADKLKRRLSEQDTESAEYNAQLESIESELHEGRRITAENAAVKTAAEKRGVQPAEVIDQLKERNPDVPDVAFTFATGELEPTDWQAATDERV